MHRLREVGNGYEEEDMMVAGSGLVEAKEGSSVQCSNGSSSRRRSRDGGRRDASRCGRDGAFRPWPGEEASGERPGGTSRARLMLGAV